jgi:hypothetical protein
MRLNPALKAVKERSRRPEAWGAVLLFAWLWNLLRPAMTGHGPGLFLLRGILVSFLLGSLLLMLAPVPWQWTGDERPSAGLSRGLFQALVWNSALVIGVLYLFPAPGWNGMMMGRGMMRDVPVSGPLSIRPGQMRDVILGLATVAFGAVLGRILADRDGARTRADEAERFAREAQTRALQAQMNPHVLFNVISGLAELARENPAATEEALVKLAELMRRLLEHAGRIAAPLAQERILVEMLLALEQFRLGERLKVAWVWDPALEALWVPPLMLQPLVENAIKHGIAPCRTGGEVEIGLSGTREALLLWVANTGSPLRKDRPEGVGLANLRQRLALMQGEPGRFDIRTSDGRTLAEVRIKPMEAGHA